MASLQDEFPELTQKIFDALRPIADIAHGDSAQVVASLVLSSVRSAFLVLLQQDLIYAQDEVEAGYRKSLGSGADAGAPAEPAEPVTTVAPSTTVLDGVLPVMETDLGAAPAEETEPAADAEPAPEVPAESPPEEAKP